MKSSAFSVSIGSVLLLVGTFLSCDSKKPGNLEEAWNQRNDPLQLGQNYQTTLDSLPAEGRLSNLPWTDTYWPSNLGGVSARWNTSNPQPFSYVPPSRERLAQMSLQELKALSPAEKYDIFVGNFDYPTVKSERLRTHPGNEDWEGLCHGWAAASYLYQEPKPVTLRNAYGQEVPFGSSDVKALLTYYQGQVGRSSTQFLGSRCNQDLEKNPTSASTVECRDTNAGAFHIILSNQIGIRKQPFIADVTRDLQIWNQPIFGFKSQQIASRNTASAGAAPGTTKEVTMRTQMIYTVEVPPNWEALNGTSGFRSFTETYEYQLELNSNGKIIGGEWLTFNRPDFLWNQSKAQFEGYWSGLNQVVAQSGSTPDPVGTYTPGPVVTAFPTQYPTAYPTAYPTLNPTVFPYPTVYPTVNPYPTNYPQPKVTEIPKDPKYPTPIPWPTLPSSKKSDTVKSLTVVMENDGQLNCQWPFPRRYFSASLGLQSCMNEQGVLSAPVSQKMKEVCQNQGVQNCQADQWSAQVYEYYYKQDKNSQLPATHCPQGAQHDQKTGRCIEETQNKKEVFGPFFRQQIENCMKKGSVEKCNQQKWDYDLYAESQF